MVAPGQHYSTCQANCIKNHVIKTPCCEAQARVSFIDMTIAASVTVPRQKQPKEKCTITLNRKTKHQSKHPNVCHGRSQQQRALTETCTCNFNIYSGLTGRSNGTAGSRKAPRYGSGISRSSSLPHGQSLAAPCMYRHTVLTTIESTTLELGKHPLLSDQPALSNSSKSPEG